MIKKSLFFLLLCLTFTACYRGDDDEDYYSIVPLTNNPDFTQEKGEPLPQMGY